MLCKNKNAVKKQQEQTWKNFCKNIHMLSTVSVEYLAALQVVLDEILDPLSYAESVNGLNILSVLFLFAENQNPAAVFHVPELPFNVRYVWKQKQWGRSGALLYLQLCDGIQDPGCQRIRYWTITCSHETSELCLLSEVVHYKRVMLVFVVFLIDFAIWLSFCHENLFSSGIPLNCDHCGKTTLPACHLAMSDFSVKNFCTLTCAMSFKVNPPEAYTSFKTLNIMYTYPTNKSTNTGCSSVPKALTIAPKLLKKKT